VPAWRTRYDQCDRPLTADLYWVGPDGALRDRSGAVLAEGPVAEIGRVNEDDPLQPQAWIAEASGAGEVYLRWRDVQTPYVVDGPLNLEPGSDARRLAFWSDGNLSLAWLETGSGGAKVVHCRGVYASPTCAEVGAPGLPVDGGIDTIGALVAFSSRIDGGAAQVRVLRGDAWSGYEDLGAVNDDAGADAFDPALLDGIYDEVAWIEGGRLFTRKRGNDWLPAVPVATGGAPRWPRLAGGEIEQASWLVWVEPGTGGDAIRAARRPWLGELEPWATVATAVNVGVPGTVAALAVSRQEPLTVTWVDGAGAVHVRVASR
jgi:hypothetical protein